MLTTPTSVLYNGYKGNVKDKKRAEQKKYTQNVQKTHKKRAMKGGNRI